MKKIILMLIMASALFATEKDYQIFINYSIPVNGEVIEEEIFFGTPKSYMDYDISISKGITTGLSSATNTAIDSIGKVGGNLAQSAGTGFGIGLVIGVIDGVIKNSRKAKEYVLVYNVKDKDGNLISKKIKTFITYEGYKSKEIYQILKKEGV